MKKEELIKRIKSLPDNKCLINVIHGRIYILSCKDIEISKGSRCYVEMVVADRATFIYGENLHYIKSYHEDFIHTEKNLLVLNTKSYHETILYVTNRSYLSIDEDSLCLNIEILESRIDKYTYVVGGLPYPLNSLIPFTSKEQVDGRLVLKEEVKIKEEKKKQDESNELVLKLKEHFVEFKKDAGISNITTTGKVDNNTERKSSVILADYPRNEKWSDETILNIINFVNSGIVYDEKQYTIVSHAVIGFIGELAGCVVMGHAWDIKNKRVVILKEKHKKYDLFFKNGKYHHCLNIIPNEEIVASYKVQGVL